MPKAYKGRIRIRCGAAACPRDRARADVVPECFTCNDAQSDILDLEDRVICSIGVLVADPATVAAEAAPPAEEADGAEPPQAKKPKR